MSQITLYVDGACRGNPGLGGWGAYILEGATEQKICGGEANTTNNRMELTAAIEGILACPMQSALVIWTDSIYVKRGITEWIHGWKKKNWKDVKNPDLWQKLDQVCQNRQIEWNWIKGHSGHPGNEMADQLANLGADQTLAQLTSASNHSGNTAISPNQDTDSDKKKADDWLLDDPFGFDLIAEDEELDAEDVALPTSDVATSPSASVIPDSAISGSAVSSSAFPSIETVAANLTTIEPVAPSTSATVAQLHPQIVITPATRQLSGPRQLILDTETTGFYYQDSDRIIEVGAIEMINRKLTGSSIHIYINPKKPVGDSENVHGISDEFLKDKPLFAEIASTLFDYLKGAEIIAHNASFDMNFLDMEFKRAGFVGLSDVCPVTDTLAMAKAKHPGQKNSLDALVRRYEIAQRDRTFHGALLDAEILADVYLAMTGGQVLLDIDALSSSATDSTNQQQIRQKIEIELPVIYASADELEQHENWVKQYQQKHGESCLFKK